MRRVARVLAVGVLTAAAVLEVTGVAHADNPYTPEEVYANVTPVSPGAPMYDPRVVDQMRIGDNATVYLLRSGGDGEHACMVTMTSEHNNPRPQPVSAWIESRTGANRGELWGDRGYFDWYAGPVLTFSRCVHWGGIFGGAEVKNTPCG